MADIKTLLAELEAIHFFKEGEICVIGCSTSEVIGEKIGTHSSDEVAETFLRPLRLLLRKQVFSSFSGL